VTGGATLDHLLYGTPDLDATVDALERNLGVRASAGGSHPGEGTRNALYALGSGRYLEVLGPDPDQPDPPRPRWVGIDELARPRLVAWCARTHDLDALAERARDGGVPLGKILAGGRVKPDGSRLRWRVTDPHLRVADGVVPFFIDWMDSPHPSSTAVEGLALLELRARHPEPERVAGLLARLGVELSVSAGSPALIARLETPRGVVELT